MIFRYLLFLLCFPVLAAAETSKPFEIPRSTVIPIVDPNNDRNYEIYVKTPRSYNNTKKVYPVIYLTDAMYTFQIVSGATRYPMTIKKMEEAIIVGISWDKNIHSTPSRTRDYTPTVRSNWKHVTGGAEDHAKFIRDMIFKEVETRYRADPTQRTYIGNSLGGLFGAYILFTHGDMFQNYILGSPSLWYDNRVIFEIEEIYYAENKSLPANVFITIGNLESPKYQGASWEHDMVKDTRNFYKQLNKRGYTGLNLKLLVIDEANHETAFPTTAIQGLYWLHRT